MRNTGMMDQMLEMMGMKKRNTNTRNGVLISLVGVGIGAVAYSMMRNRNGYYGRTQNMLEPVERIMHQIRNPISKIM